MPVKSLTDQPPTGGGKMHDSRSAVPGFGTPLHQTSFFKAVNGRGSRTAGESHARCQSVHGQRAFMQQNFENGEIREAHSRFSDAPGSLLTQSPMGFHQEQPQVDSGNRVARAFIHDLKILDIKIKIQAFSPAPRLKTSLP